MSAATGTLRELPRPDLAHRCDEAAATVQMVFLPTSSSTTRAGSRTRSAIAETMCARSTPTFVVLVPVVNRLGAECGQLLYTLPLAFTVAADEAGDVEVE